ncbi:hypothetical protein A0H81_02781 [Grifola frondosa]|uniref:Uncharacterized protein n=1 Tax=Grifola frondosa TaxID=5627 RepID=A0A1C7MPU7_GRIFR|nr:hypothetical protein A0H81_02781 [Grifola frondosa]
MRFRRSTYIGSSARQSWIARVDIAHRAQMEWRCRGRNKTRSLGTTRLRCLFTHPRCALPRACCRVGKQPVQLEALTDVILMPLLQRGGRVYTQIWYRLLFLKSALQQFDACLRSFRSGVRSSRGHIFDNENDGIHMKTAYIWKMVTLTRPRCYVDTTTYSAPLGQPCSFYQRNSPLDHLHPCRGLEMAQDGVAINDGPHAFTVPSRRPWHVPINDGGSWRIISAHNGIVESSCHPDLVERGECADEGDTREGHFVERREVFHDAHIVVALEQADIVLVAHKDVHLGGAAHAAHEEGQDLAGEDDAVTGRIAHCLQKLRCEGVGGGLLAHRRPYGVSTKARRLSGRSGRSGVSKNVAKGWSTTEMLATICKGDTVWSQF